MDKKSGKHVADEIEGGKGALLDLKTAPVRFTPFVFNVVYLAFTGTSLDIQEQWYPIQRARLESFEEDW